MTDQPVPPAKSVLARAWADYTQDRKWWPVILMVIGLIVIPLIDWIGGSSSGTAFALTLGFDREASFVGWLAGLPKLAQSFVNWDGLMLISMIGLQLLGFAHCVRVARNTCPRVVAPTVLPGYPNAVSAASNSKGER